MASSPLRRFVRVIALLFRWTLWLILVAALAIQLRVLSDGGIRVPAFALDALNRRLAAQGIAVHADEVWLDPRGRVLVVAPRLALASAPATFASAHAIALQLDRDALLRRRLEVTRVEVTGLSLILPALHSPTGADQPLLTAGEFRFDRPAGTPDWHLRQSSARVLSIPATFTGALPSASEAPSRPLGETSALASAVFRRAGDLYRELALLPLDSIRSLRVDLAPPDLAVSFELSTLTLPPHPALPPALSGAGLEDVRVSITVPLAAFSRGTLDLGSLRLHASALTVPAPVALEGRNLDFQLELHSRIFHPGRAADLAADAEASFASIKKTDTDLPPVPLVAAIRFVPDGLPVALELSTRLADAPWSATVTGDPAARSGTISASGDLTPALLEAVRHFLPEKARPILELVDPLSLAVRATIAPGGIPARVDARATSGRAVAGKVRFDRAAATLVYEPGAGHFRADDLLLVQDDSRATGSYEMDTKSLAFRFLLGGRLRPMAIEGWFSDWWDRFWANFAFGPVPPDAEVDIQGAWHDPDRTTVFVGAASGAMRLRQLPLDTLATRIQVSMGTIDLLGFRATQADHLASGAFTRRLGSDHDEWASMIFDVRSDFPLAALPLIFPAEGTEIAAPFQLTAPPRIHLAGQAFGPASETPGRQHYTLDLATPGPLRYEGFPLDHLSTRLERRDSEIHLTELRAGFADGLATGEATLSGPASERRLAFDLTLAKARLDLTLLRWREFQATRPGYVPPAAKDPKEEKNLGGNLTLSLAATGPVASPLAFTGRGTARIANSDLAQIRLLGGLSNILADIGIGVTTLKITDADARFDLQQTRLVFESLNLTGPSALVEADGTYTLPDSTLDFNAKVHPFEQRTGILSSTAGFVLSPLTSALEVKLSGAFDDPDWTFAYGPTRLFRRLTGSHPKTPVLPPAGPPPR